MIIKNKIIIFVCSLIFDFPYFANARVLLAKALHNEQHYEYEKFLKQTALIVPDREVLYHYIHNLETHWQKHLMIVQTLILISQKEKVVKAKETLQVIKIKEIKEIQTLKRY